MYYYKALIHLERSQYAEARASLRRGLDQIRQGSSPEYKPLILRELGHIETDPELAQAYYHESRVAAEKRARYFDRLLCIQQQKIGRFLCLSTLNQNQSHIDPLQRGYFSCLF